MSLERPDISNIPPQEDKRMPVNVQEIIEAEGKNFAQRAVKTFDESYPQEKNLENIIEMAVTSASADIIDRYHIPPIQRIAVRAELEPFIRSILTQVYDAAQKHESEN